MALAAMLSLEAMGCRLSTSGAGPDYDAASQAETADSDGSDASLAGGGAFDVTLSPGASDGSTVEDGRAPRDAGEGGSADAGNPCQTLYACCQTLSVISPSSAQTCLNAAEDGGASTCSQYIALLKTFSACL